MEKFGEISWSEPLNNNESRQNNKDTFLKLAQGSNIVRVLTAPHQYTLHKWKPEGDPGYGYRIMCSKQSQGGSCPLCEQGDKPKSRWYIGVIDRKTGAYKVLDVGAAVLKSIKALVNDAEWGDPNRYDLDIKVDPNGGPSGYYTVVPRPHKPLSAQDLVIKDNIDFEQLKRLSSPPTPEKVHSRIEKIMSNSGVTLKVNATRQVSAMVSDDSPDDFPAADEQSKNSF